MGGRIRHVDYLIVPWRIQSFLGWPVVKTLALCSYALLTVSLCASYHSEPHTPKDCGIICDNPPSPLSILLRPENLAHTSIQPSIHPSAHWLCSQEWYSPPCHKASFVLHQAPQTHCPRPSSRTCRSLSEHRRSDDRLGGEGRDGGPWILRALGRQPLSLWWMAWPTFKLWLGCSGHCDSWVVFFVDVEMDVFVGKRR